MRFRHRSVKIFLSAALLLFLYFAACRNALAENWQGVDESVVEKVAAEYGREPWKPFINTDQGDLLLFAFLIAGTAGGFVLGFYWRKIFCEPRPFIRERDKKEKGRGE